MGWIPLLIVIGLVLFIIHDDHRPNGGMTVKEIG